MLESVLPPVQKQDPYRRWHIGVEASAGTSLPTVAAPLIGNSERTSNLWTSLREANTDLRRAGVYVFVNDLQLYGAKFWAARVLRDRADVLIGKSDAWPPVCGRRWRRLLASTELGAASEEVQADFERLTDSSLACTIQAVFERADLETDAFVLAQDAVVDAKRFANDRLGIEKPAVSVSEEGAIVLRWQVSDRGVMMVFVGDGTSTYSIKGSGEFFAANAQEFCLTAGPPEDLMSEIKSLSN